MQKQSLIKALEKNYLLNFGVSLKDNVSFLDLCKHFKTSNSCTEFEAELNKLAHYIYGDSRKIVFNEFRQFPYIDHGLNDSSDASGLAKNYTNADVRLIKFIKQFIEYNNGKYSFMDIDYFIENTEKVPFHEVPISEMPIDELLYI